MTNCSTWKKVAHASGSNPWEKTCGKKTASIMLWARGDYRYYVKGGNRTSGSAKTLKSAKAAASRLLKK